MSRDGEGLSPAMYAWDAVRFAREQLGFHPDVFQQEVLDPAIRRGILCCSRQWGKTTAVAVKALHTAMYHRKCLVVVASGSERQSGEFVNTVAGFLLQLGVRPHGDGKHKLSLKLPNGSRIVGLPNVEATTRGLANPRLLIFDEAATVDDAVYDALLPMLATGDGALWLLSTPRGKTGFFWREWAHGGPAWTRISVKAPDCPRIRASFLEEERQRKTARVFAQEYLCEFHDEEGALFSDADITACVDESTPRLFTRDMYPGTMLRRHPKFYVGVDLGKSQDYSAIVVIERDEVVFADRDPRTWEFRTEMRFHVRFAERVPLGTAYTTVADEVRRLVQKAPLAGHVDVIVDGTGVGAPVVDLLKKGQLGCRVMPVSITGGSTQSSDGRWYRVPRTDLLGGLQSAFERRALRVSPGVGACAELMKELRSMQGGQKRAAHDDLVMALALAWWRALGEGG